jgi:hypothetical protein
MKNKNPNHTIPSSESNHYAWLLAWSKIEEAVQEIDYTPLARAWVLCQRIVDAQASMYCDKFSERVATAMAWEDLEMAFRGLGQPGVTGGVFQLWSRVPDEYDAYFQMMITDAFAEALEATRPEVLRYEVSCRKAAIATLDSGFGMGEAEGIDSDQWEDTEPPHGNWSPHFKPVVAKHSTSSINKGMPGRLSLVIGGKAEQLNNPVDHLSSPPKTLR